MMYVNVLTVFGISKCLIHVPGQEQRPRGATPPPRSWVAAKRSNPTSKEQLLRRRRRAERSYSMFKVRRGGPEEIDSPHPR